MYHSLLNFNFCLVTPPSSRFLAILLTSMFYRCVQFTRAKLSIWLHSTIQIVSYLVFLNWGLKLKLSCRFWCWYIPILYIQNISRSCWLVANKSWPYAYFIFLLSPTLFTTIKCHLNHHNTSLTDSLLIYVLTSILKETRMLVENTLLWNKN